MANPLDPIGNLPIRPPATPALPGMPGAPDPVGADATDKSFTDYLRDSIEEVNRLQQDADTAINNLTTGQTQNLSEVMNAVQKADLAFQLFNQIRNKLISAYQEIKNMRI